MNFWAEWQIYRCDLKEIYILHTTKYVKISRQTHNRTVTDTGNSICLCFVFDRLFIKVDLTGI